MSDHLHVFIMAGGSGERFWPMSRQKMPKHLLRLLSERTMLEMTVLRLEGVVPWERVYVLTNITQVEAIRAELPFLPPENILAEPEKRDTAPACALAVGYALAKDPEAVCALLPADAMIHNVLLFRRQLLQAAEVASTRKAFVTFGITPNFPATSFGYLQLGAADENGVHRVDKFVEKPDAATAESYVQSGAFTWNAGMFIWRGDVFLAACEQFVPPLAEFIRAFPAGDSTAYLAKTFSALPKTSVDYAIMEKVSEVLALKAEFDWDDVGSWTALPGHLGLNEQGNTHKGDVFQVDANNNIVIANSRVVALCGVENLIVVETPDAILVCHRDAAQNLKQLQALLPDDVK